MKSKEDIRLAVKSKLSQLKESPDDIVWTNIEKHLRKKKKRRALIFWLIGGLIGLFMGVFWYASNFNSQNEIKTTNNKLNDTQTTNKSIITSDNDSDQKLIANEDKNSTSINENTTLTKLTSENFKDKIASNDSNALKEQIQNNKTKKSIQESLLLEESPSNKKEVTILTESNDEFTKEDKEKVSKDSIPSEKIKENKIKKTEKLKDSTKVEDKSRWSFTPHVLMSNYGALNTTTSDIQSFNYGLLASYRMTKSAYIRIGIRRLDLQQTINSESENRVQYLEFPLEIKYAPFDKKINPYFTGGLSYFVLQDSSPESLNSSYYKATLGFNIGLGVETRLIDNFYLNLETYFNYQLKPFISENETKSYTLSIQTGIEYRF
jgi:hypothetical protein